MTNKEQDEVAFGVWDLEMRDTRGLRDELNPLKAAWHAACAYKDKEAQELRLKIHGTEHYTEKAQRYCELQDELWAMLERLEWSALYHDNGKENRGCPLCCGIMPKHTKTCKLSALLKRKANN